MQCGISVPALLYFDLKCLSSYLLRNIAWIWTTVWFSSLRRYCCGIDLDLNPTIWFTSPCMHFMLDPLRSEPTQLFSKPAYASLLERLGSEPIVGFFRPAYESFGWIALDRMVWWITGDLNPSLDFPSLSVQLFFIVVHCGLELNISLNKGVPLPLLFPLYIGPTLSWIFLDMHFVAQGFRWKLLRP